MSLKIQKIKNLADWWADGWVDWCLFASFALFLPPAKLPLLLRDSTDPANSEWIALFGKINPLVGKVELDKNRDVCKVLALP